MSPYSKLISFALVMMQIASYRAYPFVNFPCPCQCNSPSFRTTSCSRNTNRPHVHTLFVPDTKIIKQTDLEHNNHQHPERADPIAISEPVINPEVNQNIGPNTKDNGNDSRNQVFVFIVPHYAENINGFSPIETTNEPVCLDNFATPTTVIEPRSDTDIACIDPRETSFEDFNLSPTLDDETLPTSILSPENADPSAIKTIVNDNDQNIITNINNIILNNAENEMESEAVTAGDQISHSEQSTIDTIMNNNDQNIINNVDNVISTNEDNNSYSSVVEESSLPKNSFINPIEETTTETLMNNNDQNIIEIVDDVILENAESQANLPKYIAEDQTIPITLLDSNNAGQSEVETVVNNNNQNIIENTNDIILTN